VALTTYRSRARDPQSTVSLEDCPGKSVEAIRYPGEPHCFGFTGNQRPAAAWKMFRDTDAFCPRYLAVKPKALAGSVVRQEPPELPPLGVHSKLQILSP
jgi:hypothetical protein